MKISILMQSYLADYPGARSNPEQKFIRAVYSVIAQKSSDWELVIVSDGCTLTESLYKKYFSTYQNIIFDRINRHAGSDIQQEHASVKYRIPLSPTARAVELSSGDWITYFDSDDFMTRNGVENIKKAIVKGLKENKDLRYIVNTAQFENNSIDLSNNKEFSVVRNNLTINGLPSKWQVTMVNPNYFVLNKVRLIHKRGFPEHLWADNGDYNMPRDAIFLKKVVTSKENQKRLKKAFIPYYVRCHLRPGDLCQHGVDF